MVARLLSALAFLALLPAYGQNPDIAKYSYKIHQMTVVGTGYSCTGTAIGPHALLTASHCELPTDTITITHTIDGPEPETIQIVGRIRDEEDHSIYLLEGNTPFKDIAQFRTPTNPVPGMQVFMAGAPADQGPLYRVGVYSGPGAEDEKGWEMFSMMIGHGDSGSAIFDKDGKIGWVLSDAEDASHPPTAAFRDFRRYTPTEVQCRGAQTGTGI